MGQTVTLDAAASTPTGMIDAYEWQLGDGTTATGPRIEHTFRTRGTHTVRLTIQSGRRRPQRRRPSRWHQVPVDPGLRITVGNGSALLSGATSSP